MAIFPFSVMADTNFAFPSTLYGSFALGCVFGELWPFFPFSVMADTNFAFPLQLGKSETQTLGVSNWKFCSRTCFWGATAIFPIFRNGRHQFCISVDTRKIGDPNFRGSVIGSFALGCIFRELRPFFPFSVMADTNVPTLGKLKCPFCTQKDKIADANFTLIHFFHWFSFPATPLRFVSIFKTFMHDLGALKVPIKVHQNRLTHLCVAVVNRLGNSTSHQ